MKSTSGSVELLANERSRCVVEIGKIKHVSGDALYQPDREKQDSRCGRKMQIRRPAARCRDSCRLFERILDEARSVERTVMQDGDVKKEG